MAEKTKLFVADVAADADHHDGRAEHQRKRGSNMSNLLLHEGDALHADDAEEVEREAAASRVRGASPEVGCDTSRQTSNPRRLGGR
jgi:hypothetical protein